MFLVTRLFWHLKSRICAFFIIWKAPLEITVRFGLAKPTFNFSEWKFAIFNMNKNFSQLNVSGPTKFSWSWLYETNSFNFVHFGFMFILVINLTSVSFLYVFNKDGIRSRKGSGPCPWLIIGRESLNESLPKFKTRSKILLLGSNVKLEKLISSIYKFRLF